MDLSFDANALKLALKKAPGQLRTRSMSALAKTGQELDREVQTKRLRGRPGLRRRSGALSQSFHHAVVGKQSLDTVRMIYFTNKKYSAIHEFGGTVRPKRAKFLTIPTHLNRTPAGVTRRQIRQFPHVAFVRSRRDRLIAMAGDNRKQLRPMFVLVKKAKIPKRLGLVKTWNQVRPKLLVRLNVAANQALADAGL